MAVLCCAVLACRYQMYAQRQKWKVALVSESAAERGGLKECILQVWPQ